MYKILQIFKRDVYRLSHNLVAMIVLVGVCLIPSLYAWFNIAANMDPYSNTQGVRIAVANNDKGTTNELTGSLNAGEEIVKNLKGNHSLGWVFLSEEDAISGVKKGDYYAAIVIPEGFSESMVSVLSGKITQPEIKYYLNEKKNAIAPKVTDTGASTIQSEVNSTFISIASETLAELLNSTSASVVQGVDGIHSNLNSNLQEVSGILDSFQEVWKDFQNTYEESQTLIPDTQKTLDSIKNTAGNGAKALEQSNAILSSGRESIAQFSSGLSIALSKGEDSLTDIGSQAGNSLSRLNLQIQQASGQVEALITSTEHIVAVNQEIIDGLTELNSQLPDRPFEDLLANLRAKNAEHQALLNQLKSSNTAVANASATLTTLSGDIANIVKNNQGTLRDGRHNFELTVLPSLNQSLDSFANVSGTISGILSGVGPATDQLNAALKDMQTSLNDIHTALDSTANALQQVSGHLSQVQGDLNALASSQSYQEFLSMTGLDTEAVADFMSSPIQLKTESLYPVKNYGSAMTPFYTNLAIWVGGIVLIAIFKLEVDHDEKLRSFSATQAYLGRWLLFVIVGLIQAFIICLGDILLLKAQCISPAAFIGAGLLASFVYVNLIYALSITFKHIGKAVCVILVILQIPGSAGTYPIEMTPSFFQRLHPLLPFTYGINAMREAVAGMYDHLYWKYLGCLAVFLPIALFIGLGIRPLLLNLNRMFDKRLGETDLMICEEEGTTRKYPKIVNVVKILASEKEYRQLLLHQAEKFEATYKKRVRIGFLLILLIPLVFLILMFSISSKMVFLVLWIASIIGIALYLICLEYIHENLQEKLQLSGLSEEALLDAIQKEATDKEEEA